MAREQSPLPGTIDSSTNSKEGRSILVKNLNPKTSPLKLKKIFEKFGEIQDVYLPKDFHTQKPRSFCFIQYFRRSPPPRAVREMHNTSVDDNNLTVVMAQDRRKTADYYKANKRGNSRSRIDDRNVPRRNLDVYDDRSRERIGPNSGAGRFRHYRSPDSSREVRDNYRSRDRNEYYSDISDVRHPSFSRRQYDMYSRSSRSPKCYRRSRSPPYRKRSDNSYRYIERDYRERGYVGKSNGAIPRDEKRQYYSLRRPHEYDRYDKFYETNDRERNRITPYEGPNILTEKRGYDGSRSVYRRYPSRGCHRDENRNKTSVRNSYSVEREGSADILVPSNAVERITRDTKTFVHNHSEKNNAKGRGIEDYSTEEDKQNYSVRHRKNRADSRYPQDENTYDSQDKKTFHKEEVEDGSSKECPSDPEHVINDPGSTSVHAEDDDSQSHNKMNVIENKSENSSVKGPSARNEQADECVVSGDDIVATSFNEGGKNDPTDHKSIIVTPDENSSIFSTNSEVSWREYHEITKKNEASVAKHEGPAESQVTEENDCKETQELHKLEDNNTSSF